MSQRHNQGTEGLSFKWEPEQQSETPNSLSGSPVEWLFLSLSLVVVCKFCVYVYYDFFLKAVGASKDQIFKAGSFHLKVKFIRVSP